MRNKNIEFTIYYLYNINTNNHYIDVTSNQSHVPPVQTTRPQAQQPILQPSQSHVSPVQTTRPQAQQPTLQPSQSYPSSTSHVRSLLEANQDSNRRQTTEINWAIL